MSFLLVFVKFGASSFYCVLSRGLISPLNFIRRTTLCEIDTPSFLLVVLPGKEIVFVEHRPNLRLPLPAGPVPSAKFHVLGGFDGFSHGLEFEDCEAAADFLRFGEGAIHGGYFPAAKLNARAYGAPV